MYFAIAGLMAELLNLETQVQVEQLTNKWHLLNKSFSYGYISHNIDVHVKEWVEEFATPITTPLATHHAPPSSSSSTADAWASEFQSRERGETSTETEQW